MPTLLEKGTIRVKDAAEQKRANSMVAINFIKEKLETMIPNMNGRSASRPVKLIGDKILLLKGRTASGKSVSIPPLAYQLSAQTRKSVICSEPRVINAVDIVKTISTLHVYKSMFKENINLGYQTGPIKTKIRERGLIFCTTAILQMTMQNRPDKVMNKYQVIIVDEIHDQSRESTTLLFMIKKFLEQHYENPRCPVFILMSATFDEDRFMRFFDIPSDQYIEVIGASFPIKRVFSSYDVGNIEEFIAQKCISIHINNLSDLDEKYKDIIVFVKGSDLIKKLVDRIDKFNLLLHEKGIKYIRETFEEKRLEAKVDGGSSVVLPYLVAVNLSSSTYARTSEDFKNLYEENVQNIKREVKGSKVSATRKIIFSTPVAETGITIEGLKYCIDTGIALQPEFNPEASLTINKISCISQYACEQRFGRVGRKAPGECHMAYTEKSFGLFPKEEAAKIIKEDITSTILELCVSESECSLTEMEPSVMFEKFKLKGSDVYFSSVKKPDMKEFKLLNSPSASSLTHALEKLFFLGFINEDLTPTAIGYYAVRFHRLSVECVRMIFSGFVNFASILDLITIAAFATVGVNKVFSKTFDPAPYRLLPTDGGFLICLHFWHSFYKDPTAVIEGVKLDGLFDLIDVRNNIIDSFVANGINPFHNNFNVKVLDWDVLDNDEIKRETAKIKQCIYEGFKLNTCQHQEKNIYKTRRGISVTNKYLKDFCPQVIVTSDIAANEKNGVYLVDMSFLWEGLDLEPECMYEIL